MDTSRIKRFATEARNLLKAGIAAKMTALGFDRKGNASEEYRPRLVQGGSIWNGQLQTESFHHQWTSLAAHIRRKGINEVYEEAAYTWFNRLCAIRILQKNGLCAPVLDFADAARTPKIVDDARQGHLPPMKEDVRQRLAELLDDDTKTTEQFAVLIMAWCHANPIINACFGSAADYTELLLPNNILAEGAFLDRLNRTEFISDDDYRSPELIGWLYQFYISERKDEVMRKGEKYTADEIPAATQIFTPNWIVKYMVQNTLGRIYLDNNPYGRAIGGKWRYLVEPSEATATDEVLKYDELTDLRIADLACGSGHILSECFDLLYDLYIAEGYSRREAIESIFRHNLTGIDIDLRARQLATFALLLKACQRDSGFSNARVLPRVLSMPKPWDEDKDGEVKDFLHRFFCGEETRVHADELAECFRLMRDADTLGSIMKFRIGPGTRLLVEQTMAYWAGQDFVPEEVTRRMPDFQLILALTDKYHVIVMNPPYMGSKNMNATLSRYVKDNYPEGKADLCTVFVLCAYQHTMEKGKYAFIIPPSWLFLSTFETLRRNIIDHQTIDSLLHLSRGVFGADFGSSACVISNGKADNPKGIYFRLVERTFQEFEQSHLRMLFEQTLDNHDFKYYFKDYDKDVTELPYSATGNRIYYPDVPQENFKKIPGCPIGYWVSEKVKSFFVNYPSAGSVIELREGIHTGKNELFIRSWSEVSYNKMTLLSTSNEDVDKSGKWVPYNKGGSPRKWYGNNDLVIRFDHESREEMASLSGHVRPSQHLYYKEGATWSALSSGNFSLRYYPKGFLFDSKGQVAVGEKLFEIMTLFNTKAYQSMADIIMPTLDYKCGDVKKLPYLPFNDEELIGKAKECVTLSRQDWDAHETSWDFQENELVRLSKEGEGSHSLKDLIGKYEKEWTAKFMRLHANEEELNRQFIEIYGLEDELTPDVPLDEVTILQAGEISIEEDGQ